MDIQDKQDKKWMKRREANSHGWAGYDFERGFNVFCSVILEIRGGVYEERSLSDAVPRGGGWSFGCD